MSTEFRLQTWGFDELYEFMDGAEQRVGPMVDSYLRQQGAEAIEEEIMWRLPFSWRHWRGKKPAAKKAQPFRRKFEPMSVTISSKPAYHYLYFPDDGSNTKRHYGGQHFMFHGAEKAGAGILEGIQAQLAAIFE